MILFSILKNDAQYFNPANCPLKDQYAAISSTPGFKTYYAAALTALAAGKSIKLVISDTECVPGGRPSIIGIEVIN